MVQPWVLRALDSTLSLMVFYPAMLFYWRGTWDLYGVYIFPDDEYISNWVVFGLGCVGYLGYFLHPGLGALMNAYCRVDDVIQVHNENLPNVIENNITSSSTVEILHQSSIELSVRRKRLKKVLYFIVTRTYLYLYAVAGLAYWRGLYLLIDYYLGNFDYMLGCLITSLVGYLVLLVLRCSRSLSFPVFDVYVDTSPYLLVPSTRFQTELSFQSVSSFAKYMADSLFTYFVINTISLVTWRGAQGLEWVILAFDDPVIADVVSTAIGVACCILLFAMESYIARFAARWHGWRRLVVDDVITFVQFVGETLIWNGTWGLNTKFVISDPFLGGWVNHAIGTFLMMSLQIFGFVSTIGCSLDFPDENGCWRGDDKVTMFHTKYLRKLSYFKNDSTEPQRTTRDQESSQ